MSRDRRDAKPTEETRQWLNELLTRNDRTAGAEVGELYLGREVFVAELRRPVVIEGECRDVDRTVDLFDLMDAHRREAR